MEALHHAWTALTTTPTAFAAVGGVAWGILGGALPGISPSIAIALLLPLTIGMEPMPAMVLLASTYVGAEYGGSIPAILIRTPGTNAAAATVTDGYEMHRKGRGGEALGISLVSGVIGGLVGLICLIVFSGILMDVALQFTPPAYFALGVLGLAAVVSVSGASLLKGLMSAVLGLMIATIGTDPVSGVTRLTFGAPELLQGIPLTIVMIGIFAVSELLVQAGRPSEARLAGGSPGLRLPRGSMMRRLARPQAIGSGIGVVEGCIPGAGGSVAAFMAYGEARRWSKAPHEFGHGSPEGVAAPESANNAVAGAALVPMLSMGIPGSNSSAILLGGLLMHGLQPGPLLMERHPEFVSGLFAGLLIANLSLFLVGILVLAPAIWLVNRPRPYLTAAIFALVLSGVYAIDNTLFDLYLLLAAGVVGYALRLLGFPMLPLVLGLVLGYLIESNYRRSLLLTGGNHRVFLEDPIALGLLLTALVFVVVSALRAYVAARGAN